MNHVNTYDDDHRHLRWHGADDSAAQAALYNPEIYTTTAQYRGSRRHGSPTPFKSHVSSLPSLSGTNGPKGVASSARRYRAGTFLYSVNTGSAFLSRRGRGSSPHDGNCRGLSAPALSLQPAQHVNRQVTDATPSHVHSLFAGSVTSKAWRWMNDVHRSQQNGSPHDD